MAEPLSIPLSSSSLLHFDGRDGFIPQISRIIKNRGVVRSDALWIKWAGPPARSAAPTLEVIIT